MKTVVLGDPPAVLVTLFDERKRLGLDTHDEIWNGEYHMAPAAAFRHGRMQGLLFGLLDRRSSRVGLCAGLEFNLGTADDFRVPDLGVHRGDPEGIWFDTAVIVVEVRSPDDESLEKFDFYFEHNVEEILIADLTTKAIVWFTRGDGRFVEHDRSAVLNLLAADVRAALSW